MAASRESRKVDLVIGPWQFKPGFWPTVAAACLLPVLVSLGVWQYGRAESKQQQQDSFAQQDSGKHRWLTSDLARSMDSRSYRYVAVRGQYTSHHLLLDNRTHRGRAGYEAYSLFMSEDDAFGVLVNRGWLPIGENREDIPSVDIANSSLVIRGLLASPPRPGLLLGDSGYREFRWPSVVQWLDLEMLAELTDRPLLPMVLLLDSDQADGFVREWRAFSGISPDRHRGYALQWFSLATALVVIYVVVNLRRTAKGRVESNG